MLIITSKHILSSIREPVTDNKVIVQNDTIYYTCSFAVSGYYPCKLGIKIADYINII